MTCSAAPTLRSSATQRPLRKPHEFSCAIGILTITAEARAEFGYLRDTLGLTPGNLSRHLTVLEEAGLVQVDKGYHGRRPRTWVRITGPGRAALAAELATLTELVRHHNGSAAEQPGPA